MHPLESTCPYSLNVSSHEKLFDVYIMQELCNCNNHPKPVFEHHLLKQKEDDVRTERMQSIKETAANVAASAKAGMEKTKAAAQEKVEKMSSHDPMQKEMATQKKEERKAETEWNKQEALEHNAAAKQAKATGSYAHYTTGHDTHTHSVTGAPGYSTATQQMSAMPGHGTGQPYGGEVDPSGLARTRPTGRPGETTGHNTRV